MQVYVSVFMLLLALVALDLYSGRPSVSRLSLAAGTLMLVLLVGLRWETGNDWSEVCYVGDDVVDLGALSRAGVAVGVANAIDEVKAVADYVTEREGGHGAVREVIDMILKAQDRWTAVIKEHSE